MTTDLPRVAKGPSIHEFLRARLDPAGRLGEPDLVLPDEAGVMTGGLRWAPGAMDGVLGHHAGGGPSAERLADAVDAVVAACADPTAANLTRLYEAVRDDSVLDLVDPMIEGLAERGVDRAALHGVGRWLATTAADRGAVKVGIALLGVTGLESGADSPEGSAVGVVRALGAHDEFTLYAAVALANGLAEPDSELWALAAAVDGWGRIHCVERLRHTTDPEIRAWILRHGFRNSIMYEYLAHIAATTGGLMEALRGPGVDRELLTAAGEILAALVEGGPAEDLDDYDDGADAVEAFLGHLDSCAETLGDFQAVAAIRSFLSRTDGWEARSTRGWTADRRTAFEARCDEILGRAQWRDRVAVGLLSADRAEFWLAQQAARRLGIDTFDVHLAKIRADPLGGDWFAAWQQADGTRARQLVALARETLPLDEIATGPDDELGLGPDWRPHMALDWTLQALRDHVGVGADLVVTGLRSPVTRNRNMALKVLECWPPDSWPDDARRQVADLARADPNERTRESAAEVIAAHSAQESGT